MAHSVTGFVTKTNAVHQIISKYPELQAVSLEQGFSLFPITVELLNRIHISHSGFIENLSKFPSELTDFLAEISITSPLLYFETEYFGGDGRQLVIVFEDGKIILGPVQDSFGPINDGLRLLGVQIKSEIDEFDALGLGKHRFSKDWLK